MLSIRPDGKFIIQDFALSEPRTTRKLFRPVWNGLSILCSCFSSHLSYSAHSGSRPPLLTQRTMPQNYLDRHSSAMSGRMSLDTDDHPNQTRTKQQRGEKTRTTQTVHPAIPSRRFTAVKQTMEDETAVPTEVAPVVAEEAPAVEEEAPPAVAAGPPLDLAAFKIAYAADPKQAVADFCAQHDPTVWSLWTMVYDYAADNESLEATQTFVKEFMVKSASIKDRSFGVMHIFGQLEVEGIWLFKAEDPEMLFGSNEDTSWFTWSQVGPARLVTEIVTAHWTATGTYKDKAIQDTQVSS
jgi:Elongation factor 1 gamma, conserved domain